MTVDEIATIVRQDESQTLERKRSLSLQREGLESLCAMVNADPAHGVLVFGVAPNGEVVGVEPGDLDKAQRSISQAIGSKWEPRLQFVVEVADVDGKRVVIVAATRTREVPYHEFDGRAFIREGTVTRHMTLVEKQSLQRRRSRDLHTGPWRCDGCGSWVGMLTQIVVTESGVRKSYECRCGGEYKPVT